MCQNPMPLDPNPPLNTTTAFLNTSLCVQLPWSAFHCHLEESSRKHLLLFHPLIPGTESTPGCLCSALISTICFFYTEEWEGKLSLMATCQPLIPRAKLLKIRSQLSCPLTHKALAQVLISSNRTPASPTPMSLRVISLESKYSQGTLPH